MCLKLHSASKIQGLVNKRDDLSLTELFDLFLVKYAHTAEQTPDLHPLSYSWHPYVLTLNSRKSVSVPFIQLLNLYCFEN